MRLDHPLPRLPTVEHGSYERVLVVALVLVALPPALVGAVAATGALAVAGPIGAAAAAMALFAAPVVVPWVAVRAVVAAVEHGQAR